jgi:hypothetical protein
MKIEIRKVDEAKGIVQITTTDERWYQSGEKFYPSSSWIADYYPKGIGYYKWLANKGWDEAEAIKNAAGEKGSKVHKAIEDLLKGRELEMDDKYWNDTLKTAEELTPEEWHCIMTFKEWYEDFKPDQVLATEISAINTRHGYGGTIDFVCIKGTTVYVIDFKTSANIWKSHELQLASYGKLLGYTELHKQYPKKIDGLKLAILQLGYTKNKTKQYKLTEIEDKFDLFLHAKAMWEEENKDKQPAQKNYPLTIRL